MVTSFRFLAVCWLTAVGVTQAQPIRWSSEPPGQINHDSKGAPMDDGFSFELGVFKNGFVPSLSNLGQWPINWQAADVSAYSAATSQFSALTTVDNMPPFAVGTQAWIFGRRVTSTGSEYLLARNPTWTWPTANPFNPFDLIWNIKDANQVVIGTVNPLGPVLMKSGAVNTWPQWQAANLTGDPLNGPNQDADGDGLSNLVEFALGTPPRSGPPTPPVPVALVDGQLVMTVQRQVGNLVNLTVQVSPDLSIWQSGPSFTQVISNTPSLLVVKDLTVVSPSTPRRFIRLRAEVP